jgi:hypothetical protein
MRCHHCQGPFGMARQQLLTVRRLLNFRGYLNFCSQRCLNDYRKGEQQKVRERQFKAWLLKADTST